MDQSPERPEVPLYFGLSPNQVVAFNLAQARLLRGWTQEQAAEALEPHVGSRWSKATFSAAERSVDGERVRQFDADEIVAFARAFDLPVSWFFLPPPPWAGPGVPAKLQTPASGRFGEPLALLADLVFGDDHHEAQMAMRLSAFFDQLGPNPMSDAQQRVVNMVATKKAELVRTWSPTSRTGRPRCAPSPTSSKTSPRAPPAPPTGNCAGRAERWRGG